MSARRVPGRDCPGHHGYRIDPPSGAVAKVTISTTVIDGAADSGVQVLQLTAASNLTMTGNMIMRNCAATSYVYGGVKRGGGGLLFYGGLPTLTFHGNVVHGNAFDQVLVANTIPSMSLNLVGDAAAANGTCPTAGLANQLTWPDTARGGVGLYSAGATVHAAGNAWSGAPPTLGFDYDGPNNAVDVSGTGQQYCSGSTTVSPAPRTCGQ